MEEASLQRLPPFNGKSVVSSLQIPQIDDFRSWSLDPKPLLSQPRSLKGLRVEWVSYRKVGEFVVVPSWKNLNG